MYDWAGIPVGYPAAMPDGNYAVKGIYGTMQVSVAFSRGLLSSGTGRTVAGFLETAAGFVLEWFFLGAYEYCNNTLRRCRLQNGAKHPEAVY